MASIQRREGRIRLTIDHDEQMAIYTIIQHLTRKLGKSWEPPSGAYTDPELQEEYDKWVTPALVATRAAEIEHIATIFAQSTPPIELTDDDAFMFIRVLNILRHVAAAEMGVTDESWSMDDTLEKKHESEYRMLMVLGWIEEEIVNALESW
ncbi:MAG: DUF2017 family protein [Candidatus Dormibacteria bacterium]